jgi:hypothetical protein
MKTKAILKITLLALPLMLNSCGIFKKSVAKEDNSIAQTAKTPQSDFLQKVNDNAQYANTITSKIKFRIEVGEQDMSLTGNLRMKRNDVIQLQLMAFGFVEAARLEFTPDYVLCIDRIDKRFIKANYSEISFLNESGLNFYSLQALFWNELFMPGQAKVSDEVLKGFSTSAGDNNVIISFVKKLMTYKWLTNASDGRINMANIVYNNKAEIEELAASKKKKDKEVAKDMKETRVELNWGYDDFQPLDTKNFPRKMDISFKTKDKEVNIGIVLNYVEHETDWNTRTEVSSKYKQVSIDDLLRRFMAL